MMASTTTQVLALAAVCQAIRLVQLVAKGESYDLHEYRCMLQSVAEQNPTDPLAIYGGKLTNLGTGLHILFNQIGHAQRKDLELTRYMMAVVRLERLLSKNSATLAALGKRIERLPQQLQHFQIDDEPILASLADIYVEHLSPLGSRIQVAGQPEQLKRTDVQQKVRALLLAAVRAAVLWRQAGGHRYHFIISRSRLLQELQQLLKQVDES